jgi:hypothetical protein
MGLFGIAEVMTMVEGEEQGAGYKVFKLETYSPLSRS